MAKHNANIRPRSKISKVKESGFIKEEETVKIALSIIQASETISSFDLKNVMKLTYSLHERLMTNLKQNYQEYVSWDKKTRLLNYVGKSTQCKTTLEEIPIKEKPKLLDNELNMMDAMKQEVKN